MTFDPPSSRTVTTCSGVDLRLPTVSALARNICMTAATSAGWTENAHPTVSVQSRWSDNILITSGKRVSAWTDGSHGIVSTSAKSPRPAAFGLLASHRSALTRSSGKVLAGKIRARRGSGYSAMGPSKYSRSVNE